MGILIVLERCSDTAGDRHVKIDHSSWSVVMEPPPYPGVLLFQPEPQKDDTHESP